MRIIINGREHSFDGVTIGWATIIDLAHDGHPTARDFHSTVTYDNGPGMAPGFVSDGELIAGQWVNVQDGMIFEVAVTDRA